jgi:hypothetical protein
VLKNKSAAAIEATNCRLREFDLAVTSCRNGMVSERNGKRWYELVVTRCRALTPAPSPGRPGEGR